MWNDSLTSPVEELAWVVFLDVFGFGSMVEMHEYGKLQAKIQGCRDKMCGLPGWDSSAPITFAFSDSMFLLYPTSEVDRYETLGRCKEDVEQVLGIFAGAGLPLRGGISFGPVSHGPSTIIGEAVARAVGYEKL